MRLGATIDDYVAKQDPDALVAECLQKDYRAAAMPLAVLDQPDAVSEMARAFAKADILLAELAAWVNPLHHEPEKRVGNIDWIKNVLALSDEVGAVCCATVAGSYCEADQWDSHVGHHPENFSPRCFDDVVSWVREVLDQVKPTRTKLTLEISPWTMLDSPEVYFDVIQAVDRPGLGVHLDPANLVNGPHVYCDSTKMIKRSFDLLGPHVLSCHAKDVHWALDACMTSD